MLVASGFATRLRALSCVVVGLVAARRDLRAAVQAPRKHARRRPPTSKLIPIGAVRIIVPFPAGGPTDILSRVIAQRPSEVWGPTGGGGKPARRQYRDRGSARRQDAGRRLYLVGGDGCDHGA